MKFIDWLSKFNIGELKISTPFLNTTIAFADKDKEAAWELYVELITRVATQNLDENHGDEKTALDSVAGIFQLSRDIMKKHGYKCIEFTKVAVIILNQVLRPFTAKWHKLSMEGAFDDISQSKRFREDLSEIQQKITIYMKMLADIIGVEDLTVLETN